MTTNNITTLAAHEILLAAKRKISDPEAWGKGRRNIDRAMNTCCIAEAIEECAPHSRERRRAVLAIYNAAGLEMQWGNLVEWNDAPERTHKEVLAVITLAAAFTP